MDCDYCGSTFATKTLLKKHRDDCEKHKTLKTREKGPIQKTALKNKKTRNRVTQHTPEKRAVAEKKDEEERKAVLEEVVDSEDEVRPFSHIPIAKMTEEQYRDYVESFESLFLCKRCLRVYDGKHALYIHEKLCTVETKEEEKIRKLKRRLEDIKFENARLLGENEAFRQSMDVFMKNTKYTLGPEPGTSLEYNKPV
jgi:hypothetical protein